MLGWQDINFQKYYDLYREYNENDFEQYISEEMSSDEMEIDLSDDFNPREVRNLQTKMVNIMENFSKPPAPDPRKPECDWDFHLFQFLKLRLLVRIQNVPDNMRPGMTEEQIIHSSSALYMKHYSQMLSDKLIEIQTDVLPKVRRDILQRVGGDEDHPLVHAFDYVLQHKELHSRRIKASPNKVRNKLGVGERPEDVYNIVTLEECHFDKVYDRDVPLKWMIINPLPSDDNPNAIDPEEGGFEHKIALYAEELRENMERQPFGFVVDAEWDTFLSFIHNIAHFEDYANCILIEKLNTFDESALEAIFWPRLWSQLVTPEYAKKSIRQFSSNSSKPPIVSTICKMRDLFRHIISFQLSLSSV